jgi:hypothetical protein
MPARIARALNRLLRLGLQNEATLLRIGWLIAVVVPNALMLIVLIVALQDRRDLLNKMESDRQVRNEAWNTVTQQFDYVHEFTKRADAYMKRREEEIKRQAEANPQ